MKVALAGLAGVGAAWLIPRGGVAPAPTPSVSPSDRPGVTAVEVQLATIPAGTSFRSVDGVRTFLVRTGENVRAFHGRDTAPGAAPVYWCARNGWFESAAGEPSFDENGVANGPAFPRNLDQIQVLVAASRVTIFPHVLIRGGAPRGTPIPTPAGCPPSERVG